MTDSRVQRFERTVILMIVRASEAVGEGLGGCGG